MDNRGAVLFAAVLIMTGHMAMAQCCGDCDANGAVTIDELVTAVNHALGSCVDDGICGHPSCATELATCQADLATCQAQPHGQSLSATGQTTSYGPGSDGDLQSGAALSFTDNGDGTITDNNTGLMWEKKDRSGGIHDWGNRYTWGMTTPYTMNGTMVTEFLATLNQVPCFANHCDWRIPNIKELQTLVNFGGAPAAIDPAFYNAACATPGCTVTECSCQPIGDDWSSTTFQAIPTQAFVVAFNQGLTGIVGKFDTSFVRAVRAGTEAAQPSLAAVASHH